MERKSYITKGTCSEKILFNIEDGKVKKVEFVKGCPGNTQAVSKLVEGMEATKVIALLKGINCRDKGTSCPDQLAHALEESLDKK